MSACSYCSSLRTTEKSIAAILHFFIFRQVLGSKNVKYDNLDRYSWIGIGIYNIMQLCRCRLRLFDIFGWKRVIDLLQSQSALVAVWKIFCKIVLILFLITVHSYCCFCVPNRPCMYIKVTHDWNKFNENRLPPLNWKLSVYLTYPVGLTKPCT